MTGPTPGTDLVYGRASLEDRRGYARTLAAAGDLIPASLFAQVRLENGAMERRPSPGKIFLVAETGSMLAIHPIAALNGVHIIEGKPTISPALMSGLVRRAGHKLRVSTTGSIAEKTFSATATLIRADDPDAPFTATWTLERATRAGLAEKNTWKKYPEAMCKARAISEVCREGAEDVLMGVTYTPEELGASVSETGEVVDAEVVEDVASQSSPQPEAQPAAAPEPRAAYEAEVADQWAASINDATNDTRLRALFDDATKQGVLDRWADDPAKVREPKTIRDLFFEARARLQERVA